jgi:hypothetical protein
MTDAAGFRELGRVAVDHADAAAPRSRLPPPTTSTTTARCTAS